MHRKTDLTETARWGTATLLCSALAAWCSGSALLVPVRAEEGDANARPPSELEILDAVRSTMELLDRLDQVEEPQQRRAIREEAGQQIEAIRTRQADTAWLYYLYGRLYALTGRGADAIDQLQKFVETREGRNEWRAYRLLGDLFRSEFPRLARSHYVKALSLNPTDPGSLYGRSVCERQLGDTDEAIRLARQAVEKDERQTARYVSHLANLLGGAGQWDEALQEAENALNLARDRQKESPGDRGPMVLVDEQYQLLISLSRARIDERAEPQAENFIRLGRYIQQRAELARSLVLHDAYRAVSMGVERLGPDAPVELLQEYGAILAELGKQREAIEVFEKLLSHDPHNRVALEHLSRLQEPSPEH